MITAAPRTTTKTYAELHITGELWEGNPGDYVYELRDRQKPPRTMAEVKKITGNFAKVTRAEIVTVTTTITTTQEVIRA